MKVDLHPATGTKRLWNPVIAEYYDYENRPVVHDGTINVKESCAQRLADEYNTMSLQEPDNDTESIALKTTSDDGGES